ncbi:MAG: DUF2510 domain-containing protein [Propionicimonas sp.]
MSSAEPMAGWYPDPADASRERFWDGGRWRESSRPREALPVLPSGWELLGDPDAARRSKTRKRVAIALGFIGAVELMAALAVLVAPLVDGTPAGYNMCGVDTSWRTWCWDEHYGAGSPGDIPVEVGGRPEPNLRNVPWSDPVPVGGGHTFTTITNDFTIACALDTSGSAWCWTGPQRDHDPSEADEDYRDTPVAVAGEHTFDRITTDDEGVCALDTSGKAWCWGDDASRPAAVPGEHTFAKIGGSCALDHFGKAWCWGSGYRGQLGNGEPVDDYARTPVPVAGGHSFTEIVQVDRWASSYTCALDTAGSAWCWGEDDSGQLADGDTSGSTKFTPVPVAGGHTFLTITDSGQAWCALDDSGSAYCRHWFHSR